MAGEGTGTPLRSPPMALTAYELPWGAWAVFEHAGGGYTVKRTGAPPVRVEVRCDAEEDARKICRILQMQDHFPPREL